MDNTQPDADAYCDGAHHRTPHEVALMHLTEQCEHEQPRCSDRNQYTWIAISQMSRCTASAQSHCAEEKQTQGPLQREMKMNRCHVSRQQIIFEGATSGG